MNMSKYARDIRKMKQSECVCTICGHKFPIARSRKQRERGHIKDLYCIVCGEVTEHKEIRQCDFLNEMIM